MLILLHHVPNPTRVALGMLLITLAGLLLPAVCDAEDAKNVAVVLKSSGRVESQRADTEAWTEAVRGLVLSSGDKLRTGHQGSVAVLFVDDKSLLKLAAETEVTFHATREGGTVSKRIWMVLGDLWVKVAKSEQPHFEVETPTSVASVKGSEFYSSESGDTGNTLHAIAGRYQYQNDFGQIELLAGMTGESDGKSAPRSRPTQAGEVPGFGGGIPGYGGPEGDRGLHPVGDPGAVPEDLRAEALATDEISLSWMDVFSDETAFEIERRTDGGEWQALAALGSGATSHADRGLQEGTTYCYRVRALADTVASGWSQTACDETLLPTDPSQLTASATGPAEITVRWEDNADGELAYEVHRSADGSEFELQATLDPNIESYVDSEVLSHSEYCYRVRAMLSEGPTQFSNQSCAVPGDSELLQDRRRVIRIVLVDDHGERHVLVIPLIWPEGNE